MNTDDFLFAPLLAIGSLVLQVPPMQLGQPISAFVGAAPAVLAFAVVHRIGRRWSWPDTWVYGAATFSGFLLAVEGLYLHRSMATDEQTVGLLLVPLGIVAFYRAFTSRRLAWYGILAIALLALAPLHNLDAMVMGLALAVTAGIVVARDRFRQIVPILAVTLGFWVYFVGYHVLMARYTESTIHQQSRLMDVPELVVAWLLVFAIGLPWFLRLRHRTQRRMGWGVFGVFFGLLGLNMATPVFPGTPSTPPILFTSLLPLLVLAGVMVWVAPAYIGTDIDATSVLSLIAASCVLIFLSLSSSLAPQYLNTAYRTSTFLHFPVLVFVAVGVAELCRRRLSSRSVRVAVAGIVLVSAMASIPIAFGGLSVLNYKGVTEPAELTASEFASARATHRWVSDNHLVRIQPPSGVTGSEGPVFNWIVGDNAPPACLIVMQQSWMSTGAQFFPAPPERMAEQTYRETLRTRNKVYDSAHTDRIVMLAPVRNASC